MRKLTDHIINPVNDRITIKVIDEPGAGGANHSYAVSFEDDDGVHHTTPIFFQNGPINEVGVNGLTQEVLLAIVIDRLASFQKGPFPNNNNATALYSCRQALEALHARTKERMARGVEGQTKA